MPGLILVAALYMAWVFYSRWSDERAARRNAVAIEVERARKDVELNGGTELKIITFYSAPTVISKGQPAQLCYGVANAQSVAIDPPVKDVWPSRSRCVDVTPKRDTTYTLRAEDGAGRHVQTAQAVVRVR
jgi:hypothetical protein